MRVVTKLSFAAALIASFFSLSTIAQAHDWDRDHDHWRHERWEREHRYVERPVYVAPRPVYVAPPVVYAAPPAPSGLNLNFNIPLQ